jgi:predicted Zn-dependent protease
MLIPFFVAGVATLLQGAPVQAVAAARRDVPSSRQTSARDSLRALRTARRAQETFELVRRQYLPREFGIGSHHCDVRVGRWCVWNDETNDRMPPAEASRITEAREKLLRTLDTLGVLFPGNEWIAAQEVRYLIEAKRFAEAVHVADRCTASGSRYLCRTWAGVALHDSGAVADAHAVFSGALAAMPDSIRCRWTDISVLLEDEIGDRYGRASCASRPPLEETY